MINRNLSWEQPIVFTYVLFFVLVVTLVLAGFYKSNHRHAKSAFQRNSNPRLFERQKSTFAARTQLNNERNEAIRSSPTDGVVQPSGPIELNLPRLTNAPHRRELSRVPILPEEIDSSLVPSVKTRLKFILDGNQYFKVNVVREVCELYLKAGMPPNAILPFLKDISPDITHQVGLASFNRAIDSILKIGQPGYLFVSPFQINLIRNLYELVSTGPGAKMHLEQRVSLIESNLGFFYPRRTVSCVLKTCNILNRVDHDTFLPMPRGVAKNDLKNMKYEGKTATVYFLRGSPVPQTLTGATFSKVGITRHSSADIRIDGIRKDLKEISLTYELTNLFESEASFTDVAWDIAYATEQSILNAFQNYFVIGPMDSGKLECFQGVLSQDSGLYECVHRYALDLVKYFTSLKNVTKSALSPTLLKNLAKHPLEKLNPVTGELLSWARKEIKVNNKHRGELRKQAKLAREESEKKSSPESASLKERSWLGQTGLGNKPSWEVGIEPKEERFWLTKNEPEKKESSSEQTTPNDELFPKRTYADPFEPYSQYRGAWANRPTAGDLHREKIAFIKYWRAMAEKRWRQRFEKKPAMG